MSLPSGLPSEIGDEESIARFIRQSNYVVKTTGRIKHNAFLPAPDNDTSTFRVDSLQTHEIRSIAVEHIGERSKNGAAIFPASVVGDARLAIKSKEPPNRHANICNWSMNNDAELQTSERKTAAMVLAEESELLRW